MILIMNYANYYNLVNKIYNEPPLKNTCISIIILKYLPTNKNGRQYNNILFCSCNYANTKIKILYFFLLSKIKHYCINNLIAHVMTF